jgi:hypothetical protein
MRITDVDKFSQEHVYIGTGSTRYGQRPNRWTYHEKIRDGETPSEYLQRYRTYLDKKPDLLKDIHLLKGKTLVCQCRMSSPCIGDVLKEMADQCRPDHPPPVDYSHNGTNNVVPPTPK